MKSWLKLQTHPFRLLLYLEWILLGLAAFKILGFPGWHRPTLWDGASWLTATDMPLAQKYWLVGALVTFGVCQSQMRCNTLDGTILECCTQ